MSHDTANIAALIAASAHEAKNWLGVVVERLDELSEEYVENDSLCGKVGEIRREVGRVNTTLVRMLTLYKIGEKRYSLDLLKQPVREVIEETLLGYQHAFVARGVVAEIDCPAKLMACFDFNLIGGIVADALHNACRFARARVRISAFAQRQGVVIWIEDDGPGIYGDALSGNEEAQTGTVEERGFATGNTGLGMNFATLVASLHCHGDNYGTAELDNESRYGGARWVLFLP